MKRLILIFCVFLASCATPAPDLTSTAQWERLELAEEQLKSMEIAAAEKNFRAVREVMLEKEPQFVARAEWGLARVAEARGENTKALAHLLSLENMLSALPADLAKAELPVQKAIILHKLGRKTEALESLKKAESGVRELIRDPRSGQDPHWLSRLYFRMGSSLSEKVTEENFEGFIEAQRASQVYLLRAVATGEPEWSQAAAGLLRESFLEIWSFLTRETTSSLPPSLAARERRQKQIPQISEFLKTLEMADAYAPVSEESLSVWQVNFFELVEELIEKSRQVLYASSETMVLTEESRRLNSLRRGGSPAGPQPAQAPPAAPQPAAPPQQKQDPNL